MLSYKGFFSEVDYDDNVEIFFGTVVNASQIISFRGASVSELKYSFADVIETYLDDYRRDGVDPEKLFSGKITVRVPPVLHRRVAVKAAALKESMNKHLKDLMVRDTLELTHQYVETNVMICDELLEACRDDGLQEAEKGSPESRNGGNRARA